jgi:hypothetical protein
MPDSDFRGLTSFCSGSTEFLKLSECEDFALPVVLLPVLPGSIVCIVFLNLISFCFSLVGKM